MRPRVLVLTLLAGLIGLSAAILAPRAALAADLLMVEEQGCYWCGQWNEDISGIYAKTDEGSRAPLRRHDISDPMPGDVSLSMGVNFTPTFVLLEEGREIDRIEGYPGPDFFWGLLQRMLKKLPDDAPRRLAADES